MSTGWQREIPEQSRPDGLVRIPPGVDVPLTPRVRRLLDSAPLRRLANIRQLGLVQLVYPGATHTRLEHSLGVYRVATAYLARLSHVPRFQELVSPKQAEAFLVAALLHDVGHWPYCHPVEDIRLPGVIAHESLARQSIATSEAAELLTRDWRIEPTDIANLLEGRATSPAKRLLSSMLSGPIDVDKVDYLQRDSLHAGVPYGRNFDEGRLVSSLCLSESGDCLAITDKGRTAAELMVFARYVMFSEVYWHHAVRSATAMLQRVVFELAAKLDFGTLYRMSDTDLETALLAAASGTAVDDLARALFGSHRRLYKRAAQYSFVEEPEVFELIARRPYEWLVRLSAELANRIGAANGERVAPHEVLCDAPPVDLEVDFRVDVHFEKQNRYRSLGEVSPVVRTLAREQFDNFVKRVRVFVHPRIAEQARGIADFARLIRTAAHSLAD